MFMVIELYELWARRRENSECELVERFDRKEEIYFRMDCLDREVYKEALVLLDGHCVLYKVFKLENEIRRKM